MAVGRRPWLCERVRSANLVFCFIITTTTITIITTTLALTTNEPTTNINSNNRQAALRQFQLSNERPAGDTGGYSSPDERATIKSLALRRPRAYLAANSNDDDVDDDESSTTSLMEHSDAAPGSKPQVSMSLSNATTSNHNSNAQFATPSNRSNGNDQGGQELNKTGEDYQKRLMELKLKYMTNRAISDTPYYVLLFIYSLFIIFGAVSNSLICLTVILKPKILSPRNIYIVNLAGSDLLLCVFTMPFSFIEMSMKMWQLGTATCKLVAGLQATSIYVSTISITAIALDRHKVIVNPTHQETTESAKSAAFLLASIWLGALLLSTPLFTFRTVQNFNQSNISTTDKFGHSIRSIDFCIEKWPFDHGRGIYSVISMIFQYVVPITIVSAAYFSINQKLKKRLRSRQRLTQLSQQKRQSNLINKTHSLLIYASVIFGCSWLPLNLLNVIGDFSDIFSGDGQKFRIVFAICHLIGCSSACSNPILYGYYNKNFRKEFHQVYTNYMRIMMGQLRRICCPFRKHNSDQQMACSLPPSINSSDRDSTDFSSYRSQSDYSDDLSNYGDVDGDGDQEEEFASTTSSLNRRLCTFNSSVSANAISDCQQRQQQPGELLAGSKVRPTSAFEMRTNLDGQALTPGADCAANQMMGAQKRASYACAESLNESAGSHHYSFQTITSSRYTFAGRAVRFCLCINRGDGGGGGSNSSETIVQLTGALKRKQLSPVQNKQQQQQQPVSPNPSSHRRASKASPIQQQQQQQQRRKRLPSINEPSALKHKQLRIQRIRRRGRLTRRYRKFVNDRCECHCHSQEPPEAGSFVKRRISQLFVAGEHRFTFAIADRRNSAATVSSNGKSAAQNKPNLHRTSIDRTTESSAVIMTKMDTIRGLCDDKAVSGGDVARAASGRRVWLRFFPAIERYYNEPARAQICAEKQQQQQQQQQQQEEHVKLKAAAPATPTTKQSEQQNLIGAKVESDRHSEIGKGEESGSQTRRPEWLSIGKQYNDSRKRNMERKGGSKSGRGRHCAICRRKVVAEYRKLVEAARANRARKRTKVNAAGCMEESHRVGVERVAGQQKAAPNKGVATANAASKVATRKEVAQSETKAGLGPPIGVGLLSVVLPSNERTTSEEVSGQVRSTSVEVVELNVTDLEVPTQPPPVSATGAACGDDDNDCVANTTNLPDKSEMMSSIKGVVHGINRKVVGTSKQDDDDANKNSQVTLASADGMQSSQQVSSGQQLMERRNSATSGGKPGDGIELSGGKQVNRTATSKAERDGIICSLEEARAQMKVDVGRQSDKQKRLETLTQVATMTTLSAGGGSDLIESGKVKQNVNWANSGDSQYDGIAYLPQTPQPVAGKRQVSGGGGDDSSNSNSNSNSNTKKLILNDRCMLPDCVAPSNTPTGMQAQASSGGGGGGDQHSHASSGSSLCACVRLRSSSCTCSVSAGSDSSGSFGSSSLPHSGASLSRTTNNSASSSSSSVVSASSLTSSQPNQDVDPSRQQQQQKPPQHHQSRCRQRTISNSFSAATAPKRPADEKQVADATGSVLQLSAPTTCQTSTTGSSCSISTASAGEHCGSVASSTRARLVALDSPFSSSNSVEVARALSMTTPTNAPASGGGTSSRCSNAATQISSNQRCTVSDEHRRLSAASCGSPTSGSRHLATINELSFKQQPLANGLPVWLHQQQQQQQQQFDSKQAATTSSSAVSLMSSSSAANTEDGSGAAGFNPTTRQISRLAPESRLAGKGADQELVGQPEMDTRRKRCSGGGRAPDSTHYVV